MATDLLRDESIKRVGPLSLQRYAVARGWERRKLPDKYKFALYRRPEDPSKELFLPQTEEFADYADRLRDFLEGLARFDGVSLREIMNALLNPHSDVLKFGYDAPESKAGFIPFMKGIDLIEAAHRSISAATYDVIKPEKFHLRMSNPSADAYVTSCKMGQTDVGSFVISCICPVEPASQLPATDEQDELVEEVPAFGRQVTRHVMRSLSQIQSFIRADETNRLIEPQPGDIIISGNFVEALLAFPVEYDLAALNVSASWDRTVAQPEAPDREVIHYDLYVALEDVARQLRPVKVTRNDRFIAKVVSLRGTANSEERMEGDVVLLLLHEDLGIKAKVYLGPEDYDKACEAHRLNQYVSVIGQLSKHRKSNKIDEPSNFSMLSE